MIKGIFIGFGFSIGLSMSFFILLFALKAIKKSSKYKTKDLLKAVKKYRDKMEISEKYETLAMIDNEIKELNKGNVKSSVDKFKIKQKSEILVKNDKFKINKKIIILGLK